MQRKGCQQSACLYEGEVEKLRYFRGHGRSCGPILHKLPLEFLNVVCRHSNIDRKAVPHRRQPSGEAVLKPLVRESVGGVVFKYMHARSGSSGLMEE